MAGRWRGSGPPTGGGGVVEGAPVDCVGGGVGGEGDYMRVSRHGLYELLKGMDWKETHL